MDPYTGVLHILTKWSLSIVLKIDKQMLFMSVELFIFRLNLQKLQCTNKQLTIVPVMIKIVS